jgi:hypothetical protein
MNKDGDMNRKGTFFYLLISLLFILLAYPVFEQALWAGKLLAIFFTFILVAGVYVASGEHKVKLKISLFLAIPTILFIWTDQFTPQDRSWSFYLDIVAETFIVLFTFYTAACVLMHLMKAKKVTADILAGAACTYLLLGISWGILYAMVELVIPGSFVAPDHLMPLSAQNWSVFNYFSFVTLTTLGYGEMTPVTSRAQSLAILEAVTGVLFTALLVSRLVGMYLYQLRAEDAPGN